VADVGLGYKIMAIENNLATRKCTADALFVSGS